MPLRSRPEKSRQSKGFYGEGGGEGRRVPSWSFWPLPLLESPIAVLTLHSLRTHTLSPGLLQFVARPWVGQVTWPFVAPLEAGPQAEITAGHKHPCHPG